MNVGQDQHPRLPAASRRRGSATAGDDRIASGSGRPSSDLPNEVTVTFGLASASADNTRSTSAARLVSSKFVASARVFWASGTSAACTIALATSTSRDRTLRIGKAVYRRRTRQTGGESGGAAMRGGAGCRVRGAGCSSAGCGRSLHRSRGTRYAFARSMAVKRRPPRRLATRNAIAPGESWH